MWEALQQGAQFSRIMIQQKGKSEERSRLVRALRDRNIPFQMVPRDKIDQMSKSNHQGVLGFIAPVEFIDLEDLVPYLFEQQTTPLLAFLDKITDVRNFGAIARSAESMGVQGLIFPAKGSPAIGEDLIKTSAGALVHLNLCRVNSTVKTAQYLRSSGLQLIGITEKGDQNLWQVDLRNPTTFILGAEGKGISRELLEETDASAQIPLKGAINSLNVSVAAGLAFYESLRQS